MQASHLGNISLPVIGPGRIPSAQVSQVRIPVAGARRFARMNEMTSEPLAFPADPNAEEFARLYRLQVLELEDVALFVTTPDGRIRTWNRGVEKVFGYTEQEWLGQHASIIFNEDDRAAGVAESEMRVAAEQGRCVDIRWHQRKDGKRVYMTGILRGLRDEEGTLIGFSKIFFDDTPRKQLEDALTESNQDLQQFAFIASHDLQEPLRTLSVLSELLRQSYRGQQTPETDRILGFMTDATERLSTMVSDLLAYSQIARGGARATSVHLDEDLESALTLLRTSTEETGAVVTHGPLPNVEVDRSQMVRLFQNFLGNALKFRKKSEPPHIHVSAERREKEWIIRIADNGIGFSPEEAEKIFYPFKRLHSAEEYPGSGIGLAACKRIIERLGGRVGADSKPGEGSTFWFTLPVTDSDQDRFGSVLNSGL
jgi:PAS domain S-box-containing protein